MIFECPVCGKTWNPDELKECPFCHYCPSCEGGACKVSPSVVNKANVRKWIKQVEDEIAAAEIHIKIAKDSLQLAKKEAGLTW